MEFQAAAWSRDEEYDLNLHGPMKTGWISLKGLHKKRRDVAFFLPGIITRWCLYLSAGTLIQILLLIVTQVLNHTGPTAWLPRDTGVPAVQYQPMMCVLFIHIGCDFQQFIFDF